MRPMRPMSIFHFLTNDMTCATICVQQLHPIHTALSAKSARNSAVSGVVVTSGSFQLPLVRLKGAEACMLSTNWLGKLKVRPSSM